MTVYAVIVTLILSNQNSCITESHLLSSFFLYRVHDVLYQRHVSLRPFRKNARAQALMRAHRHMHTHKPPVGQVESLIFSWCEWIMREMSSNMWAPIMLANQTGGSWGLDSMVATETGAVTFTPYSKWAYTQVPKRHSDKHEFSFWPVSSALSW